MTARHHRASSRGGMGSLKLPAMRICGRSVPTAATQRPAERQWGCTEQGAQQNRGIAWCVVRGAWCRVCAPVRVSTDEGPPTHLDHVTKPQAVGFQGGCGRTY